MKSVLPKELREQDLKPFVVVCEGMGDVTFTARLLDYAGIMNCCVGCPSKESSGGQGVERIGQYLEAVRAVTKGRVAISGVAVVVDSDGSLPEKFEAISQGFEEAEFPRPKMPYQLLDTQPRVGIYFIPRKGVSGTLEHLLLEAAFKERPSLEQCVDHFASCAGAEGRKANQKAKMRLSAIVAVTCKGNPWASSNTMWGDEGCPVPIGSDCFNELREFLAAFTNG